MLVARPSMLQATLAVDSGVQKRGMWWCPGRGAHDPEAPERVLQHAFSPIVHNPMDGGLITALACGRGPQYYSLLYTHILVGPNLLSHVQEE